MIRFYNSINKQKEEFIPLDPQCIGIYVCGPTVYDRIHLGNARPLVVFDTLYRLLRHDYPAVVYVRNLTDIDDKIIARASQENCSTTDLTTRMIQFFIEDCKDLGILPTDHAPKATEFLPEMIAMIVLLLEKNHAYIVDRHVLFDTQSYADYGQLSGRGLAEQIAGMRVEVADYKRHSQDFILWKPSDDDQPGWDSPWGRGRPGWHIECSAMSSKLLGTEFDIHGGGRDILFPHHENERAQSCCAYPDSSFARYWVHNGLVTINGEKMSKSLGNFVTLRAMLDQYPADAVRLQLLSGHYRKPLDFDDGKMQQTMAMLRAWGQKLAQIPAHEASTSTPLDDAFLEALRDDLNTPLAIARLNVLAKTDIAVMKRCLDFMGLAPVNFISTRQAKKNSDNAEINALVQQRQQAREAKNFAQADAIRASLATRGIEVIDDAHGSRWQYNNKKN